MDAVPLRIGILGATGSIGTQALEVIARFPERFSATVLVAGTRSERLSSAAARHGARAVSAGDGPAAVVDALTGRDVDLVLIAGGGATALEPTLAAIRANKLLALATKEVLVMAGDLLMQAARDSGNEIRPVDSEHSAVWQCLRGEDPASVARVVLTASGGPLLDWPLSRMAEVTVEQVLAHPRWVMGPKVTVDSATMMNKGLELIEAHHLFAMPMDLLDVVVHPQSLVHALVEFCDGSTKAEVADADMRIPIALALSHPHRIPGLAPARPAATLHRLDFIPLDQVRFPAVALARSAAAAGGTHPAAMNAANEVAVAAFLDGRLPFERIIPTVESVLGELHGAGATDLESVLAADAWARARTAELLSPAELTR
ncbi:MAG: 1-deoxy-D-xylulose-5-phosphate reductoisomerase [Candidatus Dormibacteria bacterium]